MASCLTKPNFYSSDSIKGTKQNISNWADFGIISIFRFLFFISQNDSAVNEEITKEFKCWDSDAHWKHSYQASFSSNRWELHFGWGEGQVCIQPHTQDNTSRTERDFGKLTHCTQDIMTNKDNYRVTRFQAYWK